MHIFSDRDLSSFEIDLLLSKQIRSEQFFEAWETVKPRLNKLLFQLFSIRLTCLINQSCLKLFARLVKIQTKLE